MQLALAFLESFFGERTRSRGGLCGLALVERLSRFGFGSRHNPHGHARRCGQSRRTSRPRPRRSCSTRNGRLARQLRHRSRSSVRGRCGNRGLWRQRWRGRLYRLRARHQWLPDGTRRNRSSGRGRRSGLAQWGPRGNGARGRRGDRRLCRNRWRRCQGSWRNRRRCRTRDERRRRRAGLRGHNYGSLDCRTGRRFDLCRCCRRRNGGRRCRYRDLFLYLLFGFLCANWRGSRLMLAPLQLAAHLFGNVNVNRARVRLLFGDAEAGQKVENGLRFDLEFAGQFVDPDLRVLGHSRQPASPSGVSFFGSSSTAAS